MKRFKVCVVRKERAIAVDHIRRYTHESIAPALNMSSSYNQVGKDDWEPTLKYVDKICVGQCVSFCFVFYCCWFVGFFYLKIFVGRVVSPFPHLDFHERGLGNRELLVYV